MAVYCMVMLRGQECGCVLYGHVERTGMWLCTVCGHIERSGMWRCVLSVGRVFRETPCSIESVVDGFTSTAQVR